jgi:hypothetical protein
VPSAKFTLGFRRPSGPGFTILSVTQTPWPSWPCAPSLPYAHFSGLQFESNQIPSFILPQVSEGANESFCWLVPFWSVLLSDPLTNSGLKCSGPWGAYFEPSFWYPFNCFPLLTLCFWLSTGSSGLQLYIPHSFETQEVSHRISDDWLVLENSEYLATAGSGYWKSSPGWSRGNALQPAIAPQHSCLSCWPTLLRHPPSLRLFRHLGLWLLFQHLQQGV